MEDFEVFESALFGDDYQTDADMSAETNEETETQEPEVEDTTESKSDQEAAEDAVGGEKSEGEQSVEKAEDKPENADEPEAPEKAGEQLFTLKVNKQERQVTREEVISLAQKGADYDRVKQQYADSQQTIQALQEKADTLDKHRDLLDILDMVAKGSNSTPDQLVESLYVSFRKSAGASEDAAKLELKNARLDKELSAMKGQAEKTDKAQKTDEASSRFQRDMEEFEKEYPDVKLDDELVGKLAEDIKSGLSLTAAYRKMERQQQAERVAELERQLAAENGDWKSSVKNAGSERSHFCPQQHDGKAVCCGQLVRNHCRSYGPCY